MLPDRHHSDIPAPAEEHCIVNSAEISRIHSWIKRLCVQYAIPENVQFAADLCLEEVLSNIFLHGYKQAGGVALVRFATSGDGRFVFIVEDKSTSLQSVGSGRTARLKPES